MKRLSLLPLLAALVGCTESMDQTLSAVRIAPTISTRVTGLNFDVGDQIGLRIVKGADVFLQNQLMTYDGAAFAASDVLWYTADEPSTLVAYYPYSTDGLPSVFSIATDQRAGCTSSDLLGAIKGDVRPATTPVGMLFNHLLSQLSIVVTNQTSSTVSDVIVSGFVPSATIDWAMPSATVTSDVAADIGAYCITTGSLYRAILIPQQAALTIKITTDDTKVYTKTIAQAQLLGGKRYNLAVALTKEGLKLTLSGEVGAWGEGGSLDGDSGSGDGDSGGGDVGDLIYAGETYRTKTIAGRLWMAENLRYKPTNATIEKGIWHPDGVAANLATKGYLYNRTVALAGSVTPPVQGICPDGWHIPDVGELTAIAEALPAGFLTCAGWYTSTTNAYTDIGKGLLLSTTLLGDKGIYLSYTEDGTPTQKTMAADLGVSVRCVKN